MNARPILCRPLIEWLLSKSERLCDRAGALFTNSHQYIVLAIACSIFSISVHWPDYEAIPAAHPAWFVEALDWQTRHPLQKMPLERIVPAGEREAGFASHLNKRDTRQILPLLGYVTGLHF